MTTIVIDIDKQEEKLLKEIDCGEIPLTELPTLQGVVGKICASLNDNELEKPIESKDIVVNVTRLRKLNLL
tara:strand:+ start:464 stop:676 length:213 start_codon:yes stop_codon:yes gene_type:complete